MIKSSMSLLEDCGLDTQNQTYSGNKCIIIDFYATWCNPCKIQEKVLDELEKEYDVEVHKINVEDEYELTETLKIKNLPTIYICGNNNIKKHYGFTNKTKLIETIEEFTIKTF